MGDTFDPTALAAAGEAGEGEQEEEEEELDVHGAASAGGACCRLREADAQIVPLLL